MSKHERKHFSVDMYIPCTAHGKAGSVEYTMPHQCAEVLLEARKGSEKNLSPQKYLVSYVNRAYGLLHKCDRVVLT